MSGIWWRRSFRDVLVVADGGSGIDAVKAAAVLATLLVEEYMRPILEAAWTGEFEKIKNM